MGAEVVAKLITSLGHNLLPVEAVLADMQQLVLEPDEQKKFRQGQGLLFVSTMQRERVEHITEGQPVATFRAEQNYDGNSNSLPKLLGIGSLVKGRFKAERLLVENSGRSDGRGKVSRRKNVNANSDKFADKTTKLQRNSQRISPEVTQRIAPRITPRIAQRITE